MNRRTDAVVLGIASGLVGWEFALFLHGGLSVYFCIALGFTATVLTLESAKAGADTNASCSPAALALESAKVPVSGSTGADPNLENH